MKYLIGLLFFLCGWSSQAQVLSAHGIETGNRFAFGVFDLYRSDIDTPLSKAQFGLEVGYQLHPRYAFSGGLSFWTQRSEPILSFGGRFYPADAGLYLSHWGLLKEQSDLGLGLGYLHRIERRWLLDTQLNYLFNEGTLALRLGIGLHWSD
jgi:hypothetical protein